MSPTPHLLHALVDDAAVFPPGSSPLPDAVAAHATHRTAWYADTVGPLLVPASAARELVAALDAGRWALEEPLVVSLVVRPEVSTSTIADALRLLGEDGRVDVRGAELGWQWDWRGLGLDGLSVALEVPRGDRHDAALVDVRTARGEGLPVVAKWRTGATPSWPWPDEDELAAFLCVCAAADLPFKLTGGLHHAVRGEHGVEGVAEHNHGLLNVLVATATSLQGAPREEVAALLAVRDAEALAEIVSSWSESTVTDVRTRFAAFGCCAVTDPVTELVDLGLLVGP